MQAGLCILVQCMVALPRGMVAAECLAVVPGSGHSEQDVVAWAVLGMGGEGAISQTPDIAASLPTGLVTPIAGSGHFRVAPAGRRGLLWRRRVLRSV
jgi:hypothetical protein